MHCYMKLLIIVSLVSTATACGKGRKRLRGNNNGNNNGGNVIQRMVGSNIQTSPYTASGDDPVSDCSNLNCNFDSSCCWSNNQPPADQLNWVQGSGTPDSPKMQSSFGTTNAPSGNFLITASEVAGTSQQSAQLYSCPISCSQGDITVQLKHWQSSGTTLQVCSISSPSDTPQNCKALPAASGNQDTVTIPSGGQNQRIAIIAQGFTAAKGTVAMIDDVSVQCTICPASTTPGNTPGPTNAPSNPPCNNIVCSFESGNPCSYTQGSSGGTASSNWGVQSAPYQNPLTGVKVKSPDGDKFAASYLKKKGEKTVLSTNGNFDKDYVVRFGYYKAVEGVNLRACCDSDSNCPFDTTPDVMVSHYRVWRTASIMCPAGTKQVNFVSENTKGSSEGAVGLDNIQLLQSAPGGADSASQSAC